MTTIMTTIMMTTMMMTMMMTMTMTMTIQRGPTVFTIFGIFLAMQSLVKERPKKSTGKRKTLVFVLKAVKSYNHAL